MSQAKHNLLIGGAMLFAIVVSLLLHLGIPYLVSAQAGPTPTPTLAPDPTSTPIAALMSTQPQPSLTPDTVTYKDLVEHFERVTDFTLRIISTVVALLGAVGIVAGYFGLKTFTELHKLTAGFESKIGEIEDKVQETESLLTGVMHTVEEARTNTSNATNRLRYLLEVRDRNSEVRIRAAQQLGASNDIVAASILVELLETDKVADVRIEAAYGLGQLLSSGGEPETLAEGIQALIAATKDADEKVRRESVEALDTLVCSNMQLPRTAIQRLRELIKHDRFDDVVEAAKIALEHVKKQREGKLDSHQGDPTVV